MHGRAVAAMVAVVLGSAMLAIGACAPAAAAGGGAAAASTIAHSTIADSKIAVFGNRHVGVDAIRAYFRNGADGRLDPAALNAGLKSLYATGLFQDVKVARDGDRVIVKVVENPTIGRIAFEGNSKLKDADLKKGLHSKEGGPLWRPFVQGDVVTMTELYRQHGYYDVRIEPQMIKAKEGAKNGAEHGAKTAAKSEKKGDRVDLVFTIKEGDKLAVRKIRYIGNHAFGADKLEGVVKTGQTNLLSFLLDNDIYDADRIDNDRDLLRQFYLDHGYADAQVNTSASYEADKKGVVLTFTVDEGPLYRFGKVGIASTLKAVDATALYSYLRTQPGAPYDADAVNKTVDDLSMQLAKSGQPFADVFARADREPPRAGGAGVVNLVYTIDEGKRLYVERIEIHGNTKTHDDVIRREFDFGEGDAYNKALVDRAERRLKALGYFKTVKFTQRPGSAPDRVILDVAVQEDGTGNFSIAGGYSTSAGWLAEVKISDTNMFGTGTIGKASVTFGQYAMGFDLGLTDPYAFGQRLSLGVDLFGNETIANSNQSYDSTVYGAKLSAGTPINDQLGVVWNYSIYNQGITLDPANGTSSLPIQQAAAAGPIWVSSVGTTVTYSTLDNAKNPTSGVKIQTGNEFAGLGGAAQFAKTTEDVRYYHPIIGDVVGMVRAQAGYVTPWGGQQLPLLDGFFGGPQLVRGFAPNGFGPRDITPGTTMDNLGGNVYWTTTAQLEAPVPLIPADANLKMALFSDTGSLWATSASSVASMTTALSPSQQIANATALRSSVGVGLIWNSMFGPIGVTYAYPVAKQPYDVTQRLQFSAGGF